MNNYRIDTIIGWSLVIVLALTATASILGAIFYGATHQYYIAGIAITASLAQALDLRKEKREYEEMIQQKSYNRIKN